jgi:tetratricopeptide (TPR) repeat protein
LARKAKSPYENGHYNEALDKYDHAIKLNSSSDGAWKDREIALYLIDRYPGSLEALNRSLELISWI